MPKPHCRARRPGHDATLDGHPACADRALSLFHRQANVLWEHALGQILGDVFLNRPRDEHPSPD